MEKGTLGRLAFIIGLAASVGAAGCFLGEEETDAGKDEVVAGGGDTSMVLRSTLVLDIGCTAAKVGPRHLLLAARCVAGNADVAPGKTIHFKAASEQRNIVAPDTDDDVLEATDAGAAEQENEENEPTAADAGAAAEGGEDDAGAPKPANKSDRKATIEEVEIHPSYTAKCNDELCAFGAIDASDAKDIAVLILDADLESVPTIPIDLDTVGQSDTLLAVGSGCEKLDGEPSTVKTYRTMAVPAKTVNHSGSPYIEDPALVSRLNAGYVVTPGVGWRSTEPRICKTDIGAPIFRGGQAAVAGITSNFTMFEPGDLVPVTLHHTKVDTASKVGTWLAQLGVETTHSCSEATGGCVKKGYDGGVPGTQAAPKPQKPDNGTAPGGDAGDEVLVPGEEGDAGPAEEEDAGPVSNELPSQGDEAELPESNEDEYYPSGSYEDYSDWDAGPKKKKKKKASGCSAAPGSAPVGDGIVLVLGMAALGAVARRRRSA